MNVKVDFAHVTGPVKPMHAVNNGPSYKFSAGQRMTNLDSYREAGIPYARTHDASFYATYGGEHTVDIIAIFPDFDADPYDPASYDFQLTDEYLRVIEMAGTKTFYRLGNKIEHWSKKYGTLPPKDFHKWAVICEHIIRHYNEGWANGFHMGLEYWEIWNEPDLDPDDSTNKLCWGGTRAQFFELYHIAATHLKSCFPHLKIGGPAITAGKDWLEAFLAQLKAPLDFLSWHRYCTEPEALLERAAWTRELLDKYGFDKTESILNEWNYVRSFMDEDEWLYSLRTEKNIKGASFIAATMCACHASSIDMLMYYDARPCAMNGMYSTDFVCDKLKGYYPFYMFNRLYRLGGCAESATDDPTCYSCAAVGADGAAIMLTRYSDDDALPALPCRVDMSGFDAAEGVKAKYYLLDAAHDMELVREETFTADSFAAMLDMPNQTTYLIELTRL